MEDTLVVAAGSIAIDETLVVAVGSFQLALDETVAVIAEMVVDWIIEELQ